jgi:hypothetical protein
MKYYTKLIITAVFLAANSIYSQTNFTENVSSLWFAGQKTNVLSIATNRLAVSSNDIAGLILKMEYEIEFLDFDNVTNTMHQVLTQGALITTTNFVAEFPTIQTDISNMFEIITLTPLTQEELALERAKGSITNKPLMYKKALIALKQDGYFQ